jgi:oxygen-independent coproporphyrinogen-3 oxidase
MNFMGEITVPDFLSLYIHVPFCRKKCPYCDFFSVTDLSWVNAYVAGVCKEIQLWSDLNGPWSRMPVHSIYFGGGTPSLLSVKQMHQILDMVQNCFHLAPGPEITCEVNPGTVDAQYLAGLRQLGINRISIGVQSFDPQKLSFLSRLHTRKQVFDVLEGACLAGFSNLGLDLMYALPEETHGAWQADLDTARRFAPAHLSCYMLTIEPGTPFFDHCEKGLFLPCDRERRMDFFVQTAEVLENYGYIHYEVSNFALGQKNRSVHNSHYWHRGAYIGLGPSAHSFLPEKTKGVSGIQRVSGAIPPFSGAKGPARSWNAADLHTWLERVDAGKLPRAGYEMLTPAQEVLEQVMLGLRTEHGIQTHRLDKDIHAFMARLEDQGMGMLSAYAGTAGTVRRFKLTRTGMTCLDSIVDAFARNIFDKMDFYDNF